MTSDDIKQLERAIAEITEVAQGFGLDFTICAMRFALRISFIHSVPMACRRGLVIGASGSPSIR